MRKLLFLLTLSFSCMIMHAPHADAQIVKKFIVVKDSTVDADNTVIPLTVDNTTKAVEIHATKVSGTTAGKMVLEGLAPDGSQWVGIDSVTLANQAINFKVFPLTSLSYSSYRFKVTTTGTNKTKPIVAYALRRSN
jgi:hypothetical protein